VVISVSNGQPVIEKSEQPVPPPADHRAESPTEEPAIVVPLDDATASPELKPGHSNGKGPGPGDS
jgi:hypothetical protein